MDDLSRTLLQTIRRKLLVLWRVGWPLLVWLTLSTVVTYLVHPYTHSESGEDLQADLIGQAYGLFMLLGYLVSSLVVARRYKRLIGRRLWVVLRVRLYTLLVLDVLFIFLDIVGTALFIVVPILAGG